MGGILSRVVLAVLCNGLLAPLSPSLATERTRVLAQGLNGYGGVRDTFVSAANWATPPQHTLNYGQSPELLLTRDGTDNPLLRFTLTAIPSHSAVTSATLALYNLTRSGCGGGSELPRRVALFRILRNWDEGNQVASPIDAPGKHGATGDRAFDYFPGEGTDRSWAGRALIAGKDYAALPESAADVVDEGWYRWDVTALVRTYVRGEKPNFGLVLRDATGYVEQDCDSRSFVSSEATDSPARRPRLTVVYNPDVPFADAGADREDLTWNGSAVTLDGSGSRDRPGGDDATLNYSWRVVRAAYGSALGGRIVATSRTAPFTPDRAGDWELELTVTNSLQEKATDIVHFKLLRIATSHPRIYLTPAKLAQLKARALPSNPRWTLLRGVADRTPGTDPGNNLLLAQAKALVATVSGTAAACTEALALAESVIASPGNWSTKGGDLALVYDWCHAQLSASQRAAFIDYLNGWADAPKGDDSPGWGNYWPRYSFSYALLGLATFGDNPRAAEWLTLFRETRYAGSELPLLERIAAGGAWPEGTVYDWIANWPRIKALEAWRTATGENLFISTNWFRNRLGYLLLHRWPGVAEQFGYAYHPYPSTGDAERNRGSLTAYERIMGLILIERFPRLALAQQLAGYLAAPPTADPPSFLAHEEFLWFNPDQTTRVPSLRTHFAPGTGTVFMRSGWPDGAADTDRSASYLTFQAGDHYTYHQHYDQNSFTLFKHGDLAVDSGVYSGDGLSDHDINYYVRTLAHNTLVVYNPQEDFSDARPDASSRDGGQRTFYPASRSPPSVDYFDRFRTAYDTGDILRFEDTSQYTYVRGDASKAYNSPAYHQSSDTRLSGNVAKVSGFQREFLYLRPDEGGTVEAVALFDRVGVTQADFSGANTKLLFHTLGRPVVTGSATAVSPGETLYAGASTASAVAGDGKLFIKVLLPLQHNIRRVGGRRVKSFWVFGTQHDWHWDPNESQPRPTNDFEEEPYGEWRLEVEPADTALNHNFLTVLFPTTRTTLTMPPITRISAGTQMDGAQIAHPSWRRIVLFSAAADGSAPQGAISYVYREATGTVNVLANLPPLARYALTTAVAGARRRVSLAPHLQGDLRVSAQGVLRFSLP